MSNQKNNSEIISQYIDDLINNRYEFSSEEIHTCPACNTSLKIQAGSYVRFGRPMLGIVVECKKCNVTMATDYWIGE